MFLGVPTYTEPGTNARPIQVDKIPGLVSQIDDDVGLAASNSYTPSWDFDPFEPDWATGYPTEGSKAYSRAPSIICMFSNGEVESVEYDIDLNPLTLAEQPRLLPSSDTTGTLSEGCRELKLVIETRNDADAYFESRLQHVGAFKLDIRGVPYEDISAEQRTAESLYYSVNSRILLQSTESLVSYSRELKNSGVKTGLISANKLGRNEVSFVPKRNQIATSFRFYLWSRLEEGDKFDELPLRSVVNGMGAFETRLEQYQRTDINGRELDTVPGGPTIVIIR